MQNSIDCGIFEALWNPTTQNYEEITSRSPNSDISSVLVIKNNDERELSFYLSEIDANNNVRLIECPLSQFPEDCDIQEAIRYFISV